MRGMILFGCVVAISAGCKGTRSANSESCPSCDSWKVMSPPMSPPTVREFRGEEAAPHSIVSNPANPSNVVLVPRWVYVPFTPHAPVSLAKTPESTRAPQADRVADVPSAETARNGLKEQCLQELKALNERAADSEVKFESRPASIPIPIPPSTLPNPPQLLPLPPLSIPYMPKVK